MGVVIAFNYQRWLSRYPEFTSVPPAFVNEYFAEATLYCRNDGGGPVCDATVQTVLLNMVTAHICQLNAVINGQESPQTVGRISGASEGSVSVQLQNDLPQGSAQWFAQTKYGYAFWQATAQFRTAIYAANPTVVPTAVYTGRRGFY